MKYRIKIMSYKDGTTKYYPQYYKGFFSGWKSIQMDGELCQYSDEVEAYSKYRAFTAIELCEAGRNVLISVEYEYINK